MSADAPCTGYTTMAYARASALCKIRGHTCTPLNSNQFGKRVASQWWSLADIYSLIAVGWFWFTFRSVSILDCCSRIWFFRICKLFFGGAEQVYLVRGCFFMTPGAVPVSRMIWFCKKFELPWLLVLLVVGGKIPL